MSTELVQRIKIGPAVLFLGQEHLRCGRASNAFIDLLRERYGNQGGAESLTDYLEKLSSGDKSVLPWLHRRSQKIPINDQLATVSDLAWNHVFTSAVDEVWVRAFSKQWRSLHSIFSEKSWPQDIRNRHRLCSTFLFGCVDKEDPETTLPLDELTLDGRLQVATALFRRLPDILTPRGILVIEGWNSITDWLSSKIAYPILRDLLAGQVAVFSANSEVQGDNRLRKLSDAGILSFHEESLAEFLSAAVNSGMLTLGDPGVALPNGRQMTVNGQAAFIPKDLFLDLEPFATILHDDLTLPPSGGSKEAEYFEFLRFLEEPVKLRNWEAYARGFPFVRDFSFELTLRVEQALTSPRANQRPIIIHGETGTGKTVALANLAYKVASGGDFPVVYIERSTRSYGREEYRKLDRFLNWAEDGGAPASLVVWDGMLDPEDYSTIWSNLADRGRKAVIVGSSYLVDGQNQKSVIEAGRSFNPQERERFLEYLTKRAPEVAAWIQQKRLQIDKGFLVALYRLFPPARPSIRLGVVGEFHAEQKNLLEHLTNLPDEATGFNTLESALNAIKLDLQDSATTCPGEPFWKNASVFHGENLNTVQRLFALVMTASRYGCRVPIELVLSALGQPVSSTLLETLKTKVIIWHEAANGDLFLEARQPLEAQIYIDSLFGGKARAESELICELINALPRPNQGVGASASIDFVLELLQVLGPNSNNPNYKQKFAPHLLDFAKALTRVREERSVVSSSLMLQEATLYREGVRSSESSMPLPERPVKLETAVKVLEQALDLCPNSGPQRSNICEELAACLGTLISSLPPSATAKQVKDLYISAVAAARKARLASPNNVHPTVTLGWITRPLIEKGLFSAEEQNKISADLISQFDEAEDISMDFRQQEYYLRERSKVMDLLGKSNLSEEAFRKLEDMGSKAGYFLRARSLFGDWPETPVTHEQAEGMRGALNYLQANWQQLQTDYKCVNLLFALWWRLLVGRKPFEEEREVLPFTDEQWECCHDLTDRLVSLAVDEPRPTIRFLRAISKFHVGQVDVANQEFRLLANDNNLSAGGRRLRKLFMASKEGKPLEYDGQVQHDLAEHEIGSIWVNKLHSVVSIVPRDFDRKQLRKNDPLTDFHIAFSFLGPIAQPQHFLRNR